MKAPYTHPKRKFERSVRGSGENHHRPGARRGNEDFESRARPDFGVETMSNQSTAVAREHAFDDDHAPNGGLPVVDRRPPWWMRAPDMTPMSDEDCEAALISMLTDPNDPDYHAIRAVELDDERTAAPAFGGEPLKITKKAEAMLMMEAGATDREITKALGVVRSNLSLYRAETRQRLEDAGEPVPDWLQRRAVGPRKGT